MENQSVNRPKDLCQDEVKQRLKYTDSAITPELNSRGNFMLHDAVDRMGKLDSKAGLLAAYCGAVITALLCDPQLLGLDQAYRSIFIDRCCCIAGFCGGRVCSY